METQETSIELLDYFVIGFYFLIVFAIAGWATWKERKESGKTSSGYFLGGRNTGWFVIGASLFASNIGSEHLVGLAGAGASGGFPAAQFEILAAMILLVLGWVFVPFYLRSGVYTMPEFLERRYNSTAKFYLSSISIIAYVLTKISVTIAAGGIVFTAILGIDFWTGAIIIVVATGIYTIFGGLKAVIYTDMIQMFVLVGGAIAVTIFGLMALGSSPDAAGVLDLTSGTVGQGWKTLLITSSENEGMMSLWRGLDDADYPLLGILLGAPILGVWYWCTDQFIVQRVLAAKDTSNARKGTIFGGFLKLLPLFLFVIPGAIAMAIHMNIDLGSLPGAVLDPETGQWISQGGSFGWGLLSQVASVEVNGEMVKHVALEMGDNGALTAITQPDAALPSMVIRLLPVGVKGLVVSGLLAALMSSLSSVFNSTSTLFTMDIYSKARLKFGKQPASDKEYVVVGQLATVVLVAFGLAWIPAMQFIEGGLFKYLQSVQAYISPPIAAVFLFGIFSRRINGKGALAALGTGFVLGISRLTLEVFKDSLTGPLHFFADFNFLYFAIFLFVVCSAVLVAVSLATEVPDLAKIKDITYERTGKFTLTPENKQDMILSILLLVGVAIVWLLFSDLNIVSSLFL